MGAVNRVALGPSLPVRGFGLWCRGPRRGSRFGVWGCGPRVLGFGVWGLCLGLVGVWALRNVGSGAPLRAHSRFRLLLGAASGAAPLQSKGLALLPPGFGLRALRVHLLGGFRGCVLSIRVFESLQNLLNLMSKFDFRIR